MSGKIILTSMASAGRAPLRRPGVSDVCSNLDCTGLSVSGEQNSEQKQLSVQRMELCLAAHGRESE